MKRYITRVIVLLVAGMLVSCGGGGDSTGGGGPGTPPSGGGSPGTPPSDDGIGALPSAGAHVEESDAAVSLSPGWTPSDSSFGWSGGAAVQSTVVGAVASFTFTGTSVTWIGGRSKRGGIASVKVDGGRAVDVDLFAALNDEIRSPVLTINGLSDGEHTLTIEVTSRRHAEARSNVVVVDAFEVQAPIVSHLQEADPDVSFSDGWTEASGELMWSGGDAANLPEPEIRAKVTATAGATATLVFRGTGIRWIGYRGPDAGSAVVSVDGGAPTPPIEMYSPEVKVQEVVFTATGLADTNHTLTITATGQKSAASTAAKIFVDAFDVMTPGRRYEERDPAITYSGLWERNFARVWSEGRANRSLEAGAGATFSFTGTSVSWIGCEKSSIGRAKVFLDGAFVKEVNMGRPVGVEGYQRTIFRVDGLTNGPHTLTIEASSGITVIDAFDVHP